MGRNRPLALRSKSLERQQGNVIFLLPLISGELLQLGQQRIDQRRTAWVCTNKPLHSWSTKHLTLRVVSLDQPVAVEEDARSRVQRDLLLFVAHGWHQTQRHTGRPQFGCHAFLVAIRQVLSGVGIAEATALGVEDAAKAGHEHVGRHVGQEHLINLRQYTPWFGTPPLGDGTKDALRIGHHQRRRYTVAGDVSYDQSQATVFELEEVVEVSSYLPSRLVVSGHVVAWELGQRFRQEGLLDKASNAQLLLDALPLLGLPLLLSYVVLDPKPVQGLSFLIVHQRRLIAQPHHPA